MFDIIIDTVNFFAYPLKWQGLSSWIWWVHIFHQSLVLNWIEKKIYKLWCYKNDMKWPSNLTKLVIIAVQLKKSTLSAVQMYYFKTDLFWNMPKTIPLIYNFEVLVISRGRLKKITAFDKWDPVTQMRWTTTPQN